MTSAQSNWDKLLLHLLVDFIWKIGIVAALLPIGVSAAIII